MSQIDAASAVFRKMRILNMLYLIDYISNWCKPIVTAMILNSGY
jgi:hypothetical protein